MSKNSIFQDPKKRPPGQGLAQGPKIAQNSQKFRNLNKNIKINIKLNANNYKKV